MATQAVRDKGAEQSRHELLTRRIVSYLVLAILCFLCLFFFYVLLINATRNHYQIQRGFSFLPGKSFTTNLKNVLAEQESIATLVFDEVDTGVSGRAAQKVAEKLTQVARHKQVLCVTHLPQLAAMADTHFSVEKGESGGRTFTRVIQLDREARKAELARITGGSQVTPALLESAGELLDQADAYRKQHFV